jgi:hypothetical protein
VIQWVSNEALADWCAGEIGDLGLLAAVPVFPVPGQAFFLSDLASPGELARSWRWARFWVPRIRPAVWCCRTRVAMVERICTRLGGQVCFDEMDGDRRWLMPGDQLLSVLCGNRVLKTGS